MPRNGNLKPRHIKESDLIQREEKANTRQAIENAITNYIALTKKQLPATPKDLQDYLLTCVNQGYSLATITTRMALLTTWHDEYLTTQGFDTETNPCRHPSIVRRLRAVRKTIAAPQEQAEPLYVDQLAKCIEALDDQITNASLEKDLRRQRAKQLTSIRDKAMLLVGFWFGLRSESLTAIKAENLTIKSTQSGNTLHIFLPETKTSLGFERTLDSLDYLCPIPAVLDWINATQPHPGDPLFVGITQWGRLKNAHIHVDSIIPMLRKVLDLTGIESSKFTSHSLRRGASIWADSMGASTRDRMDWFGWKDPTSALKYVEAKPSLPAVLQKQENSVENAVSVLKDHLKIKKGSGRYTNELVAQSLDVLNRINEIEKALWGIESSSKIQKDITD